MAVPRQGQDLDRDGLFTFALTVAVGIATAGLAFAAALLWVLWIGLRTPADARGDVLLVFGKRLVDGAPDGDYRARLQTAARLFRAGGGAHILILGGRTGDAEITEADAGARLLRSLPGGETLHLSLERASGDTLTNLRNVRALLAGKPREPVVLITNRYHLARVGQMAGSLGLVFRRCAADSAAASLRLAALWRWPLEAFYVTWFATGKGWARLTRNRRMLSRVT